MISLHLVAVSLLKFCQHLLFSYDTSTSAGDDNQDQGGGVVVVTESSKTYEITPDSSLRVARLVQAERACWDAGGCCLRLAGLYDLQRGAHNYWLTSNSSSGGKVVAGSPDGLINLLHYEDAAAACRAALRAGPRVCQSKAFLISDGHPLSRYAICHSALKAKVYQQQGFVMPSFAGDDDQPGARSKIYDGTVSNQLLNWRPRYESFDAFMEANA
jgi:nucleoside-diphosphate-sugar epimerase